MATIERQYLPPPDYETTIAEADRLRIYDAVRRQLGDLLEGNQSYFRMGSRRTGRPGPTIWTATSNRSGARRDT